MNFETYKRTIKNSKASISFHTKKSKDYEINNEALFQIPFLAMVLLIFSKSRSKPNVSDIGSLVGIILKKVMVGYKKSEQHLDWSGLLRIRTIKALNFLELASLVTIDNRKKINITDTGKKVVNKALKTTNDLSYNLQLILREYKNINHERKYDSELL